ncbi:transglutaminase-like domain-containing protein [Kamptonema cortianum]|nr:transglutaminase-like domain-containing protein [Geitlerinema splendidum]MDK3158877.1 transglutaminase-like domain-containing protein [Kamptonema cortianum]
MKFRPERNWIDYVIAIVAGALATYSIAMSVNKSTLAYSMTGAVLACGLIGYFLSRLVEGRKVAQFDGWFTAVGAFAMIGQVRRINGILPEGGFPFELLAAVIMLVLLCVGCIFAWRDGALLFLTLPGIVLFGLVGVIDWAPGVFSFCAYLILVATLYARVHQRTMMDRAKEAGANPQILRRGAWRWVAGPEYAFLAASTILVLSFIGAPLVRLSLNQVSGGIQGGLRSQVRRAFNTSPVNVSAPSDISIGNGPVRLSENVLWRVQIEGFSYLRTGVFPEEASRGWDRSPNYDILKGIEFDQEGKQLKYRRDPTQVARTTESGTREIVVQIRPFANLSNVLPLPGPVIESNTRMLLENRYGVAVQDTGRAAAANPADSPGRQFVCLVPGDVGPDNQIGDPALPSYFQIEKVNVSTVGLANRITENIESPYRKAVAIKNYIAANTQYNLDAPRVPRDRDPVDFFLNDSKQGYCDLYASAFVQMARASGLPARYVTGYLISPETRQSDGSFFVREKDAHSWAEVYFEGAGWVPFDATEGTVDITPNDKNQEGNFLAQILNLSKNPIVLGALASVLGIVGVVFLIRSTPRAEKSTSQRLEILRQQLRLQRSIELLVGAPRRFSQTMSEYVETVADQLHDLAPAIMATNQDLEEGIFGRSELSKEATDALKAKSEELRRRLKQIKKSKA